MDRLRSEATMRYICTIAALLAATLSVAGAQEITWRFDTDGDLEGWTPSNFATVEVRDGMLRGVTEYDCMLTSPELNIDADKYTVVEFRVSSTVTAGGELFWHHADNSFAPERKRRHVVYASDEPRVYRSPVGEVETWRGTISRIRLDILNPAGAEIALDYVRITSQQPGVVPNAGFEDDLDRDGVPDAWRVAAAGGAWSSEYVAQGDRSLMLASTPRQREATATAQVPLDRTGVYALGATVTHTERRPRVLAVELSFFDVFGEPLHGADVSVSALTQDEEGLGHVVGEVEVPRLAASAELSLRVEGVARVWWDAIKLRHVRESVSACQRPLEGWRARWIWAEATRGEDDAPAFFRHTFRLAVPPEKVTAAEAQITVDDIYALWVNGEQLSQSTEVDGWKTPEVVDLAPHLLRGTNVIAVEARDVSGAEGLLFEGAILWPRGSLELLSDATWKALGEPPPEGWQQPDFDDGDWPAASVIAEAGSAPWERLPYEYLGPRETVELVGVTAPKEIAAGDELVVSAVVSRLPQAAAHSPLRMSLLRDGNEVLCSTRPVADATEETEDGVRLGPVSARTSRFLPPGDYQVALGFPHTSYPEEDGIGIGALKVRPPATAERRPEIAVRKHNGLPTLFLDGSPSPFMHYQELIVGPERIENMADAGIHTYFLRADDIGWTDRDRFDYTDWDAKVLDLLRHDPRARIIPAFTISGRHQQWWLDEHPGELARTESGSDQVGIYHHAGRAISLASKLWREESGRAVAQFVNHCGAAPYSSRILGYLVASGVSWEWQHWGSVGDHEPTDYSEPMQQAFRDWLREHYESEEALREAWRMPQVSFETVRIPPVEERDGADHMLFRDPRTYRYVIDFYLFYQDVMAEGILHYLGIVKDASGGQALAGTYYGYVVTMLSGARRAGDSGHMALSTVMRSELCDFLISPWDYSNRAVGEPTTVMSAIGSVLANGKLWAMETDLRTHLADEESRRRYGGPEHLQGTISQHRRAVASALTKGAAVRWYDFSNGWISSDPRQTQAIGQLREIAQRWVGWDRSPDPNGIAVVVDEDTPAAYLSHHIEAMRWLVARQKAVFERVGAPWNIYLIDDIVAERVPKFRAYFFLNCFHMTERERRYVEEELQSDGRTLVWFYAPGYIEDDLDVARVSRLTGMQFREIPQMREWRIALTPDSAWTEGIGEAQNQQPGIQIGPVFVPDERGIEVLGRWAEGGEPGLAVARLEDHTSVYSAAPILSPMLLKRICRDAGVPVRVEGTEPCYVSRNLIGLHAAVPRTETLRFSEPTRVIDLVTGEILAAACTELEVAVDGPGTRLLRTYPAY
ncbi:MAG: beta-galactosidase [Armatimonadota bacterium]